MAAALLHEGDPIKFAALRPIRFAMGTRAISPHRGRGLYSIADWTLRVIDAHHHELITSHCELCPTGLFIATVSPDHGLEDGRRVLIQFCSGELRFELGASVFHIGWCNELGCEGVGLRLDSFAPEAIGASRATPTIAAC